MLPPAIAQKPFTAVGGFQRDMVHVESVPLQKPFEGRLPKPLAFSRSYSVNKAVAPTCFTNLPIRIHKDAHLADAGTLKLLHDYSALADDNSDIESKDSSNIIGSGSSNDLSSSTSELTGNPFGNFSAMLYPEAIPDRLQLISYLNSLIFLHDDVTEALTHSEANKQHSSLIDTIASSSRRRESPPPKKIPKAARKELIKMTLKRFIDKEPILGQRVMDEYTRFLQLVDESDKEFESMSDYIPNRIENAGAWLFMSQIPFAMSLNIDSTDRIILHKVELTVAEAAVLTNDYYSWDREWIAYKEGKSRSLQNAIAVLMRERGLDVTGAKKALRQHIIRVEKIFSEEADKALRNLKLSNDAYHYVEALRLIAGGHAFYCATAPRYQV